MLVICLSLIATRAWAQPVNLLADGSFEGDTWELAKWDHGTSGHEFATPGRTGETCLHFSGLSAETGSINEVGISPVLPIKGGDEYLLSVWYRATETARASLSFLTYTEPFKTAAWKTPRAQYDTLTLPPSEGWRRAVWRFKVAQGTVEMRILVRLGGVGEVWYDDASLAPVGDFRLYTQVAADLSHPPNRRLYAARVECPAGARWTLSIEGAAGEALGSAEGTGPAESASVEFAAEPGDKATAVLAAGDAIVDQAELAVPPVVEASLLTGRYRNTLYASARPQAVEVLLSAHATPEMIRQFRYAADLEPENEAAQRAEWQPFRTRQRTLRFPTGHLAPGKWHIAVRLQGVPGVEALELPLTVAPPGAPHEVIVDDANRLVVDGKPLFPCGFYGPPTDDEKSRPIAEAGYNAALTYTSNPEACWQWLDMCERLGLWGIVHLPRPFVGSFDETKLREAIRAVKEHPALLAYYLFDEPHPDKPGETVDELRRVYDVLRDEDPYHPVTICINIPQNESVYLDCYDVVMIDVYPVRSSPDRLTVIADRADHAWASTGGRKPVWFIPQTFGWDVVEGLDREPTWLTPTPEQERVMQYLALAHGVRGSIAYCYHVYTGFDPAVDKEGKWPWKLGGYLPTQQPVLWEGLVELGADYRALSEALVQPQHACQVFADGGLHVGWFHGEDRRAWLVVVNAGEETLTALLPALPDRAARASSARYIIGGGQAPVREAGIDLSIPPMSTLALEVFLGE